VVIPENEERIIVQPLFLTHLVGSWSRPSWLSSPSITDALGPPEKFWRPARPYWREAQDDATRLAIYDQLALGLDIVTDGEQRRQLFDRYFYGRLEGVDPEHLGVHTWGGPAADRASQSWRQVAGEIGSTGGPPRVPSPRVTGPVAWPGPLAVADYRFLNAVVQGQRQTKMTVSGPITALNRLVDEYYHDRTALGHAIAQALHAEAHALADAGCKIIQFDEPEFRTAHLSNADESRALINEVIQGLRARGVTTFSHMCYGYANAVRQKSVNPDFYQALELMASTDIDGVSIEYAQPGHQPDVLRALAGKTVILGVINCAPESAVESVDEVMDRIRGALTVVPANLLQVSTDCGLWFLPRERAWAKVAALVEAVRRLRDEYKVVD
jgi:5-methyltetrahydropteroyltriglutamate--homocysteine methyltransferase